MGHRSSSFVIPLTMESGCKSVYIIDTYSLTTNIFQNILYIACSI